MTDGTLDGYIAGYVDGEGSFRKVQWNEIAEEVSR